MKSALVRIPICTLVQAFSSLLLPLAPNPLNLGFPVVCRGKERDGQLLSYGVSLFM